MSADKLDNVCEQAAEDDAAIYVAPREDGLVDMTIVHWDPYDSVDDAPCGYELTELAS